MVQETLQRLPTERINGKFAPGTSGNPNGQPKSASQLRKWLIGDPRVPLAVERILYMATDPDFGAEKPELQLRAAEYVGDQALGKATQSIHVEDDTGPNILQLMAQEFHNRALAMAQTPPLLEEPDIIQPHVNTPTAVPTRGRPKGSRDKTPRKQRQPKT